MFIITIDGREDEGEYSVRNEFEEQVLYIFEEEDDATRFAMMLENSGSPEMNVIEVDKELILQVCELHGHSYIIFDSNDIVIPPIENDTV
jgi:hypothetical protein